ASANYPAPRATLRVVRPGAAIVMRLHSTSLLLRIDFALEPYRVAALRPRALSTKMASTSSKVLPFVSGTKRRTKNHVTMPITAYSQKTPAGLNLFANVRNVNATIKFAAQLAT